MRCPAEGERPRGCTSMVSRWGRSRVVPSLECGELSWSWQRAGVRRRLPAATRARRGWLDGRDANRSWQPCLRLRLMGEGGCVGPARRGAWTVPVTPSKRLATSRNSFASLCRSGRLQGQVVQLPLRCWCRSRVIGVVLWARKSAQRQRGVAAKRALAPGLPSQVRGCCADSM